MPEIKTLNGIISVGTNNLKEVCLDVRERTVKRQIYHGRAWMTRESVLELIEALREAIGMK